MKLVSRTSQYAIFDDVLPAAEFEALFKELQLTEYRAVHRNGWDVHRNGWENVWRILDGTRLVGPSLYSAPAAKYSPDDSDENVFPSHSLLDLVVKLLLVQAGDFEDLIGRKGEKWDRFILSPYLYPAGTALSWHADSGKYAGAFTFYAHPSWNVQWGGELFIADPMSAEAELWDGEIMIRNEADPTTPKRHNIPPGMSNERENKALSEVGIGTYVVAKPNRLVVLAPGQPHMIARVQPNGGDHIRCSISGFFLAKKTESLLGDGDHEGLLVGKRPIRRVVRDLRNAG